MILLGDYEGLGVSIVLLLWLLATVPAFLLALAGMILALRNVRRFLLPVWMGVAAGLVELGMAAVVWTEFFAERARLGEYAKRFRPGMFFWLPFAGTMMFALISLCLGLRAARSAVR